MKITFEIPLGFFETYGTGTLPGSCFPNNMRVTDVSELELVFHSTSMMWKRDNGGPHVALMTEHVPLCFLQDILWLQAQGITVSVSEKTVNPAPNV